MLRFVFLFWLAVFAVNAAKSQSFAIANDKMNVLYMGVDNFLTVAAEGVATKDLVLVSSSDALRIRQGDKSGVFVVSATSTGEATVELRNKNTQKVVGTQRFRIKRIPDPVAQIGTRTQGSMQPADITPQMGMVAVLENFDYDAKCEIISFTLYYTKPRQDALQVEHQGGRFSGMVLWAVKAATPGDRYNFTEIKARCPGDNAARTLNPITITIR